MTKRMTKVQMENLIQELTKENSRQHKSLDPKIVNAMSNDFLGGTSDEDLFRQLHECCNPNCLVINEVVRRYKELERNPPKDSPPDWIWENPDRLWRMYINKKKECEKLKREVDDLVNDSHL